MAKKAAMRALDRVRKSGEVTFERLMGAVAVYARAVAGKDIQFVAHPATWLNGGRWDDEPAHNGGAEPTVASAFDSLLARALESESDRGAGLVEAESFRRH